MQVLTTASFLMGSGATSGECTREGGRAVAASGAKGGGWEACGRHEAGHREAAANSCGGWHGGGQSRQASICMQVLTTAPCLMQSRQANRTHQHASAHYGAETSGWAVGGMRNGAVVSTCMQMPPVGPWAAWATVTSPFLRISSRDLPNKGQGSRPGAS